MRSGFVVKVIVAITLQIACGQGLGAAPKSVVEKVPAATVPHRRLLPLQGGRNFRDLGGYQTADRRHVKWGLLFRSGSMHGLTAADYDDLEKRGIRTVCDFRDNRERSSEPVNWPAGGKPNVLSSDYTLDIAGMMPKGPPAQWTENDARAAFAASYPRMLAQFNGQYRRMFAELLAGRVPLAFNCSAGKDRTGIAAALILTALDVPRRTVIDDYLLTNQYLDTNKLLTQSAAPANMPSAGASRDAKPNAVGGMQSMPPGVLKAILAADPAYIAAALTVLDHHRGGPAGYFRDELGVDHAGLVVLRKLYLE